MRASGPLCGGALPCDVERYAVQELEPRAGSYGIPDVTVAADGTAWFGYLEPEGDIALTHRTEPGLTRYPTRLLAPFPMDAPLFARAGARTYVLGADRETFHATVLALVGDRVEEVASVPARPERGFVGDTEGCVYLLTSREALVSRWRFNGGEPELRAVFDGLAWGVDLSLADDRSPHVALLREGSAPDRLDLWWSDGLREEIVERGDSYEAAFWDVHLEVTGHEPHLLYLTNVRGSQDLRYATRTEAGWFIRTLTRATSGTGDCIPGGPAEAPDETCSCAFTNARPIAVLADETGSVRLIYGVLHQEALLHSVCLIGGPCYWEGDVALAGELHVVDPEGVDSVVASIPVLSGRGEAEGAVIHLALVVPTGAGATLEHVTLRVR